MTNTPDIPFDSATVLELDAIGPLAGTTTFAGVNYVFTRRESESETENEWGTWFDLWPVDPDTGFTFRAIGNFRDNFNVRWTAFGCPDFTSTTDYTALFTDFLHRLNAGTATYAHWQALCVAHYRDDKLERVRRDCVRHFLHHETLDSLTDVDRDMIKRLIADLTQDGG
ncbi:hypothetical protein [Neorhodopirellula lusitana]|uniref:hypothetical protein n=1 Tax=Neorhodopirellula lusitana TaxID=445327 RepID=UPI00384F93A0